MLSVSNVSSAGQGMSYYASDNYYTQSEGVENSSWHGEGAKELGLTGKIDKENFENLLNGKVEGQQLGKLETDENGEKVFKHLSGMDLTFSAPKSVSIMAEIFEDERVKEAHKEAVDEVLDAISKEAISTRVMKDGVMTQEKTDKVIIAKFDHDTNRNQDPNTHTHTLILNAVKSEDGKWKSIDNRELYASQRLYGAMYTNKLAEKIQGLGYDIAIKDDKGNFEIKGVSDEAIDKFSSRKNEIDERLSEMGLTRESANASQRETATLATREKKVDLAHDQLRGEWQKAADKVMEVKGESIIQGSINKESDQSKNTQYEGVKGAKEATRSALKNLTEREAVVDEKELRQRAYERGVGSATTKDIDKQLGALEKQGVILKVNQGEVTTKAVVNSEKWTINTMTTEKDVIEKIVDEDRVIDHIISFEEKQGFKLKEGQANAVKDIFNTKDRFVGVQGLAGTGKTTMLQVVKNVADEHKISIRGMSGTKKAANTLMAESGIKSETTAMFVIKGRQAQREWDKALKDNPDAKREKEIWVVDESSFAGQKDLNTIADLAVKADARVVFIGDKLQLQAIDFGKPFEVAQEKGMQTSEMKDINRQKTEQLKTLVDTTLGDTKDSLEAINIEKAMKFMQKEGMVVELKQESRNEDVDLKSDGDNQKTDSLISLVDRYLEMSKEERADTKIITPFNKDRVAANDLIREGLKDKGEVGAKDETVAIYKSTGKTSIEMNEAWHYKEDEIVVFGTDVRHLGIEKDEAFKVKGLNENRTTVHLEHEDGREIEWNPAKRHRAVVYKAESIGLSEGDQIRFTRNDSDNRYTNNMEGSVIGVDENGSIKVATEDGKELTLNDEDKYIDHNYTSTVYGSQGSTYKNTFLYVNVGEDLSENEKKSMSNVVGDRMLYVAITRAKENFSLYTPNAKAVEDVVKLKQDKRFALGDMEKNKQERTQEILDKEADKAVDKAINDEGVKKNLNRNNVTNNIADLLKNRQQKAVNSIENEEPSKNKSLQELVNGNLQNIDNRDPKNPVVSDASGNKAQEKEGQSAENISFKDKISASLDQSQPTKQRDIDDQLQL